MTNLVDEPAEDHAKLMAMRIILTILFGGLLMVLVRIFAQERVTFDMPRRRRRPLLTVEEAVRWRPE
jgi:hypothetical protein